MRDVEEEFTTLSLALLNDLALFLLLKETMSLLLFSPLDSDNSEISKLHKFILGETSLLFSVLTRLFNPVV